MIPKPTGPSSSDEQELDAILDNIDRLVEHQCKKATDRQKADTPPTQAFSPERVKKTQQAFQKLSESKLLFDESGSDLSTINNRDASTERKRGWPRRAALG